MAHASYFTHIFPFETHALPAIYPMHRSLLAPVTSEHSFALHDLVPEVVPTGYEKIHGIPSDPIVQAFSAP